MQFLIDDLNTFYDNIFDDMDDIMLFSQLYKDIEQPFPQMDKWW